MKTKKKWMLSQLVTLSLLSTYLTGHAEETPWNPDGTPSEKADWLYAHLTEVENTLAGVRGADIIIDSMSREAWEGPSGPIAHNIVIGNRNEPLKLNNQIGMHRVVLGYNNLTSHSGVSIGDSDYALGLQSVTIGYQTHAYGYNTIAIGTNAAALPSPQYKKFTGRVMTIWE